MGDVAQTTSITIDIDAEQALEVAEVWPDGEAPDQITAAGVAAAMLHHIRRRGRSSFLSDWGLLDGARVTIICRTPNPAWTQDEALPGMTPPEPLIITSEEVPL